jgi:hypothetical protein
LIQGFMQFHASTLRESNQGPLTSQ